MAVGSYNGSIYLIGGVAMQTLTKYSIDLNTLTHIEPVPWERGAFLLNLGQFWTQQDDILYVSPYISYAGTYIVSLDLATLVYSRISAAPQDLGSSFHGYYCLASSTDYIYVTGALQIQNSNLLQVLQISTGQWTMGNQMNVGRRRHSCVASGRFLYVFGGHDPHVNTLTMSNTHTINLTSTERIDINQITSQNWSYAVPLIQAVIHSRAVSCGDKLFVLGGRGPDGFVDLAQIIDPLTQSISTQTMPYAVIGMGAICFEQDVYVLGGIGGKNENKTLDSVFYYTEFTDDPTTDPITMRPTGHPTRDPSKVPTARTQHPTSLTLSPSIPPTNSTPITLHPTSLTLSPSVILTTANPTTSIPPTNSPQMTVDNVAGSNDAWIATLVSAIVSALVVVLIYCLYKYLKKKKQKVTEDQVVVMAVNQNKPKPVVKVNNKLDPQEDSSSSDDDSLYINKQSDITTDHGEGIAKNETEQQDSEPKQEDDILDNEEDSSDGDSLYVINTQNGDKTTATNDIAIDHEEEVEREGIAKNTELRQEEKSEKSSSCNS
eukprot:337867_1